MREKLLEIVGHSANSIKDRTFKIMTSYVAISALIATIIFGARGNSPILVIILLLIFTAMVLLQVLQERYGKLRIFSLVAVIIVNGVMLPLLYIFGGGLKGGMPMIFASSTILPFILLDGMTLTITSGFFIIWYSIIMTYTFYKPGYVKYYFYDYDLLADMVVCLVVGLVFSCTVWFIYQGVYKGIRENLEEAKKRVEQSGIVKSRFLANMSHELRTPMNAILGMSELLERNDDQGTLAYEAGMIKESAYALLTTINNVLNYSKLESGKEALIRNQFRFSQLITDVIYTVNMEIDTEKVRFVTTIDPSIPDLLYGDDTKVRSIFTYILFLAVRNTTEGRIVLDVSKEIDDNSAIKLNVRISDTGYGLTPDEKESVFRSYEMYDTRKNSQLRRIGLELTICRYLVELMGGSIEIASIPTIGNDISFSIRLFAVERAPIVNTRNASDKRALVYISRRNRQDIWTDLFAQFSMVPDFANSYVSFEAAMKNKQYDEIFVSDYNYEAVKPLLAAYSVEDITYIITNQKNAYGDFDKCKILRRPLNCLSIKDAIYGTWDEKEYKNAEYRESFTAPDAKVLIVDDNIVNVRVAQSILSQYEVNIATSTSGRDAIEKIKNERFDLILLDQMMPEMDGLETLRHIRGLSDLHSRRVPVICLTANSGGDVREELLSAGFQEYLAKPIKIRYLEEILKTFLSADLLIYKKDKAEKKPEATNKSVAGEVSATTDIPSGLNTERGLLQLGGDQGAYNLILNTYYKDCLEKLESIPKMFEDGDIPLYNITVHAVKGSSATIGALEVSELFRQLEMAGKGGDLDFCRNNTQNALNKLTELLGIVKEYLIEQNDFKDPTAEASVVNEGPIVEEENDVQADNTVGNTSSAADADLDIALLNKMVFEIDRINFDESDRILEEILSKTYDADNQDKVDRIKAAYDDFDYAAVKDIVKELS